MNLNTYLVLSICALTTFSCTKETNVQPVAQQANETFDINNITSSEKPGAYFDEAKGTYKLVLQAQSFFFMAEIQAGHCHKAIQAILVLHIPSMAIIVLLYRV